MNRRSFLYHAGLAVLAAQGRFAPTASADEPAPENLGDLLEGIRKEHQLPGLAAAVVGGDKIVAEGVAGVRKVGTDDKITPEDRFLIGSCTKRMTATMVCRVIDDGKLAFDTPLAEALPEVEMREDYRKVTIAQLLTFTGGLRPYMRISPEQTPILFEKEGSIADRRKRIVTHMLQEEPVAQPGTERIYSNASYVVAAFAASHRTGRPWETLMEEEIFTPLQLAGAGFGRARSKERPNEPWRHIKRNHGYEPEPEGGLQVDPGEVMAGPGGVHCSIRDFAKFAAYELSSARGNDPLLKPATAKRWRELSRGGQEGRPIRGGTPWVTAGYVLWPSTNRAVVAAVNGGGAFEACKAVFDAVREP